MTATDELSDAELDDIAPAQPAVDREIKERAVT